MTSLKGLEDLGSFLAPKVVRSGVYQTDSCPEGESEVAAACRPIDDEARSGDDPGEMEAFSNEPPPEPMEGQGDSSTFMGGYDCPEVKGPSSLTNPGHIVYVLFDRKGCVVPIRYGVRSSWGASHIRARYDEGLRNHLLTQLARNQMQQAIIRPGALVSNGFLVYAYRYTNVKGQARTRCVWVDYKNYDDYERRGITTAFHKTGHMQPHQCDPSLSG